MQQLPETQQPDSPPCWLTIGEAAAYLRVSPRTLYRAVKLGRLRAAKVNQRGDLRISRLWLDQWLGEASA